MKETQDTIISVRASVDPDSAMFYELTRTLRELSTAAGSIRSLTNSLGRNPQSVIVGYPEAREEK